MLSLRMPGRRRDDSPAILRRSTGRASLPAGAQSVDFAMLWVAAALLLTGLVMVYSATIALPDSSRFANYTPTHFLVRHLMALSIGIGAAVVAFAVPVRQWQVWSKWLFLIGLVLLVIVLIPGVGKSVYGARRWLSLYVFNLQPSELMKLFVVLYAADFTVRKQDYMHTVRKGFLPMGAAVALVGLLLLLEPDMGAFVVIAAIAMGVLFLGGVNGKLFAGLVVIAGTTFSMLIWLSPWRRDRIFAYLDPFDDANALGKGYQLSHSLIACGRGELFGVGLGGSVGKLH
ncbi:MAG: cell division protein FtsW, partial [Burkholderiales bacterium]